MQVVDEKLSSDLERYSQVDFIVERWLYHRVLVARSREFKIERKSL